MKTNSKKLNLSGNEKNAQGDLMELVSQDLIMEVYVPASIDPVCRAIENEIFHGF
jgi:hypothetical protein